MDINIFYLLFFSFFDIDLFFVLIKKKIRIWYKRFILKKYNYKYYLKLGINYFIFYNNK